MTQFWFSDNEEGKTKEKKEKKKQVVERKPPQKKEKKRRDSHNIDLSEEEKVEEKNIKPSGKITKVLFN